MTCKMSVTYNPYCLSLNGQLMNSELNPRIILMKLNINRHLTDTSRSSISIKQLHILITGQSWFHFFEDKWHVRQKYVGCDTKYNRYCI